MDSNEIRDIQSIELDLLAGNVTIGLIDEYNEAIRREARAEALREAADMAVAWYRQGQIIPAHKESYAIKSLRAAILADEPAQDDGKPEEKP